jgi:fatty-acyl-CoA synthase
VITPWNATHEDLMNTVGRTIGDAEVQVLGLDGRRPLPAGEVGELCFRGCGAVHGYIGAAADDNDAFLPGGWLRSGDLGEVDHRDVITLRGRAQEMYIQGGFNVYPAEVEPYIARHPQVLMVAGIGVPDPMLGEVGRYYVVPQPGGRVIEASLRDWCAQGLADYKVPRRILFLDELPLTPVGKMRGATLLAQGGSCQNTAIVKPPSTARLAPVTKLPAGALR